MQFYKMELFMLLSLFKNLLGFIPWTILLFALLVVYRPDFFFKTDVHKQSNSTRSAISVPVTVDKVIARSLARTIKATGSFKGLETIAIISKVEGRVSRVFHDIGDEVYPGEPLLSIDETDFKLGVSEAKRSLELEMSKLGLSEMPSDKFDLSRLPMVAKANILEKNASNKLERFRRLGTASSIEERDHYDTEAKVAKVNLENAILEANTSLATARYKQALLYTAEQKLKDTKLVVPSVVQPGGSDYSNYISLLDGKTPFIVYHKSVSEGELVHLNPTEPLFRITLDRVLKLQVALSERELLRVKVGQIVLVQVEAYPGRSFTGALARIYPTIDPSSRTFLIEIAVLNIKRELKPGFFAKVSIEIDKVDNVLTVPEESIITFAGVNKVFKIEGQKVKACEIKIGQRILVSNGNQVDNWVEIIGGLKIGDQIVTTGQNSLAEDSIVKIREPNLLDPESNKDF